MQVGAPLMQGVYPPGTFAQLGLPGNWYGSLEWQYPPHQRQGAYEEEGRAINTLKVPTLIYMQYASSCVIHARAAEVHKAAEVTLLVSRSCRCCLNTAACAPAGCLVHLKHGLQQHLASTIQCSCAGSLSSAVSSGRLRH